MSCFLALMAAECAQLIPADSIEGLGLLAMSPLDCQHVEGHEMIEGNIVRIKVTDVKGGRLGACIRQVTDASKARWRRVRYLSASDGCFQWYIPKPGQPGRVSCNPKLHLCDVQ